jgi:hypothetical protein
MSKRDLESLLPVASGSKRPRIESSNNEDEMDKKVLNHDNIQLLQYLPPNVELSVANAALVLYWIARYSDRMKELTFDQGQTIVEDDEDLYTTLNSCWAIRKFADVRRIASGFPLSASCYQACCRALFSYVFTDCIYYIYCHRVASVNVFQRTSRAGSTGFAWAEPVRSVLMSMISFAA